MIDEMFMRHVPLQRNSSAACQYLPKKKEEGQLAAFTVLASVVYFYLKIQ
jgi:hypothetical protein